MTVICEAFVKFLTVSLSSGNHLAECMFLAHLEEDCIKLKVL